MRALPAWALAGWLLAPATATAGPSYQVPTGPRALAMGCAFGALADDATAGYWNPAGLPLVGHQEVSATHADLFGTGLADNYLSFVLPLTLRQAAAVDWFNSGFDDGELGYHENRIQLAYGRRVHELVSAGIAVKYLNRSTEYGGVSVRQGGGFGVDLGLLAFPRAGLRMAVTAQDVTNTRLHYEGGDGTAVAFPRNLRGAVAWEPLRDLTLAFDADDRWHAGAEYRLLDILALRGGLQKDWRGPDELIWSAGTGVKLGFLRFDYGRVEQPGLGPTDHFGFSFEFNFNPAQVRIERAESRDVYASLLKSYVKEPLTTLHLRNLDTRPIRARVSFYAPSLMTEPSEQQVVLRPKASQEVELTAVLSEKVLEQPDDRPVQARIAVTYQSARLPRTERHTTRFIAYGPGAIDWSTGVEQAAAFVTSLDPVVEQFARRAVRSAIEADGLPAAYGDLSRIAAIVDALSVAGVTYVPDPNNPYSRMSATPHAVDMIAYPRETLARRSGDCDDTTVLLAALLGNVGIASRFVDVPGHLFLLADTGVHERQQFAMGLDASRFVIEDGRVWVPIESTALSKGFTEAWRLGSDGFASWKARGRLALVDVAEASSRYEPVEPGGASATAPAFDADALDRMVRGDMATVAEWRSAFMAGRYGQASSRGLVTEEALNELAHVYFTAGRIESAESHLQRALALAPRSPRTLNNLGDVRVAQGNAREALDLYAASLRGDSSDAGVWLNLGLVRYATGDSAGAGEPMALGLDLSGGYDEACRLLGIVPEQPGSREGTQRMTVDEVRLLLREALKRVPRTVRAPVRPVPAVPDSLPHAKSWTSRVAGSRGAEATGLGPSLYWR